MAVRGGVGVGMTPSSSLARRRPEPDRVHLWWADLERWVATDHAALADHERVRAHSFAFAADAVRFLAARVALRRVLSVYLGCPPGAVALSTGKYGKPRIAQASPLRFNLSHTRTHVAIVVCTGREVGIDIEPAGTRLHSGLDELLLAPSERSNRPDIETAQRGSALLSLWTRKEAVLKAMGWGLARDPRSVVVGPGPDDAEVVESAGGRRFRVATLCAGLPSGHCGAIAVELSGSAHALLPCGEMMP